MKHLVIMILAVMSLKADMYTDYIDAGLANINTRIDAGFNNAQIEFGYYNELVVDTSAAMIAMSNIDFFKHEGFSVGVGVATLHTPYGNGNAYALGVQYGINDIMINCKGSYKGDGEYIIGSGLVVGF